MNLYRATKSFRGITQGQLVQLSFCASKFGTNSQVRVWSPFTVGKWVNIPDHAKNSFEIVAEM